MTALDLLEFATFASLSAAWLKVVVLGWLEWRCGGVPAPLRPLACVIAERGIAFGAMAVAGGLMLAGAPA